MNLLKPGRGDMLDRLTILSRKMVERPGRKDFEEEYEKLCAALGPDSNDCSGLAALNAAIWQREDRLRFYKVEPEWASQREAWTQIVVRTAFEIQELNDRRAALIAEINGTESEKLYK